MSASAVIPFHDSLYAHHSYASHLPQRLDEVVSEYLDSGPWKIRFGRRGGTEKAIPPEQMSGEDLCLYNGADCRVTIKAWHCIQRDLAKEYHVYEHDLCLAELCADMQIVGIRVDKARQTLLSRLLEESRVKLKREMQMLLRDWKFAPGKPDHVRRALFDVLKVKKTHFTATGLPTTSKALIEGLRGEDTKAGKFAGLLIAWREASKIKRTYVDYPTQVMFPLRGSRRGTLAADPHRAHYSWGPREKRDQKTSGGGHTVSGRLACRLQSAPRYNPKNLPDRVRELYVPGPGREFVYFDVGQGEPRVAAFLSGDPVRIQTTYGDVHANNAKTMFPSVAAQGWLDGDPVCPSCKLKQKDAPCTCPKKDPARGKPCRDLAKNMGLAIDYFAEAERVYTYLLTNRFDFSGRELYKPLSLNAVNAIIQKIRFAYRVYVAFVYANLSRVKRQGFMRDPILGRIRWLGWNPSITDVANYPIQSCLAAVMNLRSLALRRSPRFIVWAKKHPRFIEKVGLETDPDKWPRLPPHTPLVAQVHDACIYDVLRKYVSEVKGVLTEVWRRPIHMPGGELVLPIDLKSGSRWSDLG